MDSPLKGNNPNPDDSSRSSGKSRSDSAPLVPIWTSGAKLSGVERSRVAAALLAWIHISELSDFHLLKISPCVNHVAVP